ncbi:hypothetical protein ORF077L [Largemouth bass ulcerative syndrome virus]|nr:074L [Spotted knifejaw iridovirus]WEP24616.1 hypothetical protein ORF077L [Largemouth bass ulcerative syndrome virus]
MQTQYIVCIYMKLYNCPHRRGDHYSNMASYWDRRQVPVMRVQPMCHYTGHLRKDCSCAHCEITLDVWLEPPQRRRRRRAPSPPRGVVFDSDTEDLFDAM